ncbi:membrane-associated protease RseP (regulator of RpoE activity) [Haloactinopolyspora alba]|uniref:Membrane-associated protease RseP (Regulator of RpoE activity) n=1 Tax=Haloactinopolyspora alba TaxID=648780 RepID=A0A2P8DVA4_9ACTN|nr:site-2 protease family protein [Haloactinopolyspora alba]PSL01150.1 membrane-associated protease RseP (regulator of RpoE activity) [Haloactinopolyspora alba]
MDLLAVVGIVLFFVGLMLSIALHEVGHLVPAKLFGVKVSQYMVGFGKTIWSRRRGETEYGVKAVPLGGYVRMIGMFPPELGGRSSELRQSSTGLFQTMARDARNSSREEIGPGDEDRVFYRKAWWKKLIVMLGGPAMNVVLAVLLAGSVLMTFGNPEKPVYSPVISSVNECVIPASENRTDCAPSDPRAPANEANFRPGDEVLSVGSQRVSTWPEVSEAIADAGAGPVEVVVERDGEQLTLRPDLLVAERPDPSDEAGDVQQTSFLGIAPTFQHFQREDVAGTLAWTGDFVTRTAEAMSHIPQRMVDVWDAAFGGGERGRDTPVSIVGAGRIGGEIASADALDGGQRIATFLMLLASFNMAIALLNLVPLLPLDGGHAAGALWEALKRAYAKVFRRPEPYPVDVAKALPIAYGVAVVLVGMSALLIYADFVNPVRLFG